MKIRFDHNINNFKDSKQYFINRSKQFMFDDYFLQTNMFENLEWGTHATFINNRNNKSYHSVYVYYDHRNKGKLLEFCKQNPNYEFITSTDCNIENWFIKNNIQYKLVANHTQEIFYKTIEQYYGDKFAKRSGVFYMNHIDEGLYILKKIGASKDAQAAYCLHPLVQVDESLKENYYNNMFLKNENKHIMLSMEYRSIANEFLSWKENVNSVKQIRISPLKEVNDMLVADKIQNYKDFILHHKDKHPRSKQLDRYFLLWFEKLNISLDSFQEMFLVLSHG